MLRTECFATIPEGLLSSGRVLLCDRLDCIPFLCSFFLVLVLFVFFVVVVVFFLSLSFFWLNYHTSCCGSIVQMINGFVSPT